MRATLSRQVFFMLAQDVVLAASIAAAIALRWFTPGPDHRFDPFQPHKLLGMAILWLVFKLSLHYFELYDISTHKSLREFALGLLKALFTALVLLSFVYYFDPPFVVGRGILAITVLVLVGTIPLFRIIHHYVSGEAPFTRNLLLVGTGPAAKLVIDEIEKYQFSGYTIAGIVADEPDLVSRDFEGYPVIGGFDRIPALVEAHDVDTIIVALSEQRGRLPIGALIDCKLRGMAVISDTTFHEQFTGKIMVESLRPSYFIFSDGFKLHRLTLMTKRIADVVISLVLLIAAAPLIGVAALAVRLSSPGPILYRQERAGLFGKPFHLYKFRSMVVDSETGSGPVWAKKNDARVTRVGRVLRRFRIDELPQIYNILKGEMSFVGPRPERPYFVEQLADAIPYYKQRLVIKPGLTGWAQIRFPYGSSVEDAKEKLQYDLYYVKNLSWLFDLKIISETTKVVLGKMGEGTY
jgi:sugar transferase (PEP-CTERM system associated)